MGGRGSASNIAGYTPKQKVLVDRLKRMAKEYRYEDVKITMGKDGAVNYEYTEKRRVTKAHAGKMIDPSKDKIYERTTKQSGKIMPDGLRKKNKAEVTDKFIKIRGKR